jgi:sporulation protein YlmC with PRC-barrel domain
MLRIMSLMIAAFLVCGGAHAQSSSAPAEVLTHVRSGSMTVATWYKQSVYDVSGTRIGEISDVLLDAEGRVAAIILGVGNFLGVPDNDIAVAFSSIRHEMRDGKSYLTMVATKDSLKVAPKFKFDKATGTWTP